MTFVGWVMFLSAFGIIYDQLRQDKAIGRDVLLIRLVVTDFTHVIYTVG